MIYVGIDDTDVLGSPGTNKLARWLIGRLPPDCSCMVAVRHQLLVDRRIPYTSKNSSASLLLDAPAGTATEALASHLRRLMEQWLVAGSDPGLCVAERVPEEVTAFGRRCQTQIVTQRDARELAAAHNIRLEGLGGTEDGVIGALAAIGLVASGQDGRVVSLGAWPDDLSGPQDAATLLARGVAEIRLLESGGLVTDGRVAIGKRLRPNWRDSRAVLFVRPMAPETACAWEAVRLP